jgi:hypothetical protein
MRSTSPRLNAGMWSICWAAIRLLRLGTSCLGSGYLGGEVMRGGDLTTRISSVNPASRRAASPGEGESSTVSESVPVKGAEGMPSTSDIGVMLSAVHWGAVEEGSHVEACPSVDRPPGACTAIGRAATSNANSSNIGSTEANLAGGPVHMHIAFTNGSG